MSDQDASKGRCGLLRLLYRHLVGLNFPDPQKGQLWRSANSGKSFEVWDVEVMDWGTVHVHVREAGPHRVPAMPDLYAWTLPQWRRQLREERRELLSAGSTQ